MNANDKAEQRGAELTEKFLSDLAALKCDKETYLGNVQSAIDELRIVEEQVQREIQREERGQKGTSDE